MSDQPVGTDNPGGSPEGNPGGNPRGESVATVKAQYEARLSGLQSSNDKLRQENEALKKQFQDEVATHSITKAEMARLGGEVEQIKGQLSGHETEKKGLRSKLNKAQAILEGGEGIIADLVLEDEDMARVRESVERAKKVHTSVYERARADLQAGRVPANNPPRTSPEEMTPEKIQKVLAEAAAKGEEAFEAAKAEIVATLNSGG